MNALAHPAPENDPGLFRSQHAEDRILDREIGGRRGGYFVEVGSYNGESYSNTYYFEKALGWTGVLIEADPHLAEQGRAIRPGSATVNCAIVAPGSPATVTFEVVEGCRWVSSICVSGSMLKRIEDIPVQVRKVQVQAKTLDAVLEEAGAPGCIDFVSIDVEGHEWGVLQGFTASRWQPRVIILERNDHLPDQNIMRWMKANGYGWRRTTGCNDWFYAASGTGAGYRANLVFRYYLPKYLTIWKPLVSGPGKRFVKKCLRKAGALDLARRIARRAR